MNESTLQRRELIREPRLRRAFAAARDYLLQRRTEEGYWRGRLSSSALATATAVSALSMVSRGRHQALIAEGERWLSAQQNKDGGWGDTPDSRSNIPTTLLVEAALCLANRETLDGAAGCLKRAESFLCDRAGRAPEKRLRALRMLYGNDRTFAIPIMANCALAGSLAGREDDDLLPEGLCLRWEDIPRLPYELGCLPHGWLQMFNLRVVSYALPALIAIGQLVDQRSARGGVFRWLTRLLTVGPTLRRLDRIQPEDGGFLEAVPLTGFVVMSLAGAGRSDHPVCKRGIEFIRSSRRADGSWPIDSNLSNWLTTMSVRALSDAGHEFGHDGEIIRRWIITQQHTELHPYTHASPGGWAWTHLPGGVPDADDTASALLALSVLDDGSLTWPAQEGARWLMRLQNEDGGWPTFCRGWGRLPFDRSAPDLTGHALRALNAWRGVLVPAERRKAVQRGLEFLERSRREDGSWVPLWFGNQAAPRGENPVYGTAQVLAAYRDLGLDGNPEADDGRRFLLEAQNADGSWGGAPGVQGSMEETALAVGALAHHLRDDRVKSACLAGCRYLADRIADGGLEEPAPIGLYFARLWYSERLYPAIWTTSALARILANLDGGAARRQNVEPVAGRERL